MISADQGAAAIVHLKFLTVEKLWANLFFRKKFLSENAKPQFSGNCEQN